MNSIEIRSIEISNPEQLLLANDCVHDLFFNLDDLIVQEGSIRFVILFQGGWRGAVDPLVVMIIRNVTRMEVRDTERVSWYDVNTLKWEDGCLTVATGIPLELKIWVSSLHITLLNCEDKRKEAGS
ncbi:MAG: hypothetical protein KIT74_11035 [Fimbriimonadales bacterium]|nr:hypothetical protein [Fimbriimonadales bacterium]